MEKSGCAVFLTSKSRTAIKKKYIFPTNQLSVIFLIKRLVVWSIDVRKCFQCFPDFKYFQFTVTEEERKQKIITSNKLESENSDF